MSDKDDQGLSLEEHLEEYYELRDQRKKLYAELLEAGETLNLSSSSSEEDSNFIAHLAQKVKNSTDNETATGSHQQGDILIEDDDQQSSDKTGNFRHLARYDPDHDVKDIKYFIDVSEALNKDLRIWRTKALNPDELEMEKLQVSDEVEESYHDKYQHLELEYERYRSEIERYHSENERYRSENERYRSENERYRSENEKYRSENEKYRSENDKYRSENGRYRSENEKYRSENDKYRSENEKCCTENIKLTDELLELKYEHKTKMSKLQRENSYLRARMDPFEQKYLKRDSRSHAGFPSESYTATGLRDEMLAKFKIAEEQEPLAYKFGQRSEEVRMLEDKATKGVGETEVSGVQLWESDVGYIRGVDHLPGGLVVAACYGDGLRVYDQKGRAVDHPLVQMCKGKFMDVCVSRSGTSVAVTEDRYPAVLHMYDRGSDGWKHQQYEICDGPQYAAMMSDGHVIVRSYRDYHLYKYTAQGVRVWHKPLDSVLGVAADHLGRIIVCHEDHITVYDGDCKEAFSFPKYTSQDKLYISVLCVDGSGNILVHDYKSRSVLQYSSSGDLIRRIIIGLEWMNAACMAVSDDGKRLAVGGLETLRMYQI